MGGGRGGGGRGAACEVRDSARARGRLGKKIIHLEIGEPDFDTPANVVEAGIGALRQGWTHYGPSAGMPELRQAISEDVSRLPGVWATRHEVVGVPGGARRICFTLMGLPGGGGDAGKDWWGKAYGNVATGGTAG